MISRLPRPVPRPAPKPAAVEPVPPVQAAPVIPADEVEFDEDGRRILTAPLAAPARPVPTVMPRPGSSLPRPVGNPAGLLAAFPRPVVRSGGGPVPTVMPRPTFTMPSYPANPKPAAPLPVATTSAAVRRPAPPYVKPRKPMNNPDVPFGPDDIPFTL